jgi:hypothetical protein
MSGLKGKGLLDKFPSIKRTTLLGIIKNKENILSVIDEGGSAKLTRIDKGSDLDLAVLTWFKIQLSNNIYEYIIFK